jgi:DnaJ-class molecular chaperone
MSEQEYIDCRDCHGTGIGWGGPDSKCLQCGGRGYFKIEPEPEYDGPDNEKDVW